MKNYMILLLLVCSLSLGAQVGPNVVASAGGLVYTKGTLDAELILDIIATKKGEIKSELGKRLVLSRIENGSFAFYNYAEKNLEILFNEANKEIIMKEVIRNSTELMLVYSVAELYLQDLKYRAKLTAEEKKLLEIFGKFIPPESQSKLKASVGTEFLDSAKVADTPSFKSLAPTDYFSISGLSIAGTNINKPLMLNLLCQADKGYSESKFRLCEKNINYNISHVFVDMVYDVCRQNQYVLRTGLFQNNNFSEERYSALNKFKLMEKKDSIRIYTAFKNIQPEIKSIVDNIFIYYSIMEELGSLGSLKKEEIEKLLDPDAHEDTPSNANDKVKKAFKYTICITTHLKDLKKALDMLKSNGFEMKDGISETLRKTLETLNAFANKKPDEIIANAFVLAKDIEQLVKQVGSIQASVSTDLTEVKRVLVCIQKCVNNGVIQHFIDHQADATKHISNISLYVQLVNCINNLDRVESYDYIFKYITNLGETYGSQQAKTVVRWITAAADKYTTIDKEKNNLTIDVEAIAIDFYKRFGKSQQSRINFLFSVGTNVNISSEGSFQYLVGSEQRTFNNQQFVSEKVGLRFNLVDFNRKRQLGNYDLKSSRFSVNKRRAARIGKNPLVDNIHVQAFGSGLLYQIQALNSQSDFTKPMYGFGTGVTFFNGLDFSFNYMAPFDAKNIKNGFFNFAFDISFMEYLGELKKKRSKA